MATPKEHGVTHELLAYKLDQISDDIKQIKCDMRDQSCRIEGIESSQTREKGFIGGALFVATCVWVFATEFFQQIIKAFQN